ncbi:MAG: hypothetical protein Q4G64_10690 [bacterium]|nr:hypothetical protein [bacterium]
MTESGDGSFTFYCESDSCELAYWYPVAAAPVSVPWPRGVAEVTAPGGDPCNDGMSDQHFSIQLTETDLTLSYERPEILMDCGGLVVTQLAEDFTFYGIRRPDDWTPAPA